MKKILLATGLMCMSFGAFAQLEIGLKFTPNMGWNRVEDTSPIKAESDGGRAHLNGGIVIDYFFSDNYAFSTGLVLATKGGSIKYADAPAPFNKPIDIMVQYVELPVTLKLFTNEVMPDARVYFQVGGAAGVLTGARIDDEKNVPTPTINDPDATTKASKSFNTLELSGLLGAGLEFQLGESTKLFGGLTYQHGISNIEDKDFLGGSEGTDKLTIKNSMIGLDIGLKF